MRSIAHTVTTPAVVAAQPIVQRACACGQHSGNGGECADCRRKRETTLQRAALTPETQPDAVPSIVQNVLGASGQPLERSTRATMDTRFGHDFSTVRVHTDAQAAESARAVGARAYTVGRDVVFGAGQYQPHTPTGQHLLAHELAHTIQQASSAGSVQRSALRVGPIADAAEREAEQIADAVVGSGSSPSIAQAAPASIQRAGIEGEIPRLGQTSYVADTELITCMRIMGEGSREACLQQIGDNPQPTGCVKGNLRSVAVQPVFFRSADDDATPTGGSWANRFSTSNTIWNKLGVTFTENAAITLTDATNKTAGGSRAERDRIRGLRSGAGIEVFVVDNDLADAGGGGTVGGGSDGAKMVMSDRGTSSTLLAHELGHVLGLGHPPDGAEERTIMAPSSSHSAENPTRNTMNNYRRITWPAPGNLECINPDI